MARDAIARQYDVDKNSIQLDIKGGLITFFAKKGKSIDLDQIHASIHATRLSGSTGMRVHYLEVTATGEVVAADKRLLLQVAGTKQQFVLGDEPNARPAAGATTPLQRLWAALAKGQRVTSVTGRVDGWNGPFPKLLNVPPPPGEPGKPPLLIVTDFQTAAK